MRQPVSVMRQRELRQARRPPSSVKYVRCTMPGASTTPVISLTLTGDFGSTDPALVTVRIDAACQRLPDAPISVNSGSRSSETWAGEARTPGSRSRVSAATAAWTSTSLSSAMHEPYGLPRSETLTRTPAPNSPDR